MALTILHNQKALAPIHWSKILCLAFFISWLLGSGFAQTGDISEIVQGEWISLFNGIDLEGWRGNLEYWSVKEGYLTGAGGVDQNTFLIYDSSFSDFILEADVMLVDGKGNSGIQYRSKVIDEDDYAVSGYQLDMGHNSTNDRWGKLVEEKGREDRQLHLAPPECAASVKDNDWNRIQITADSNHLVHYLNGIQCVDYYDTDSEWASFEGIIALQLHTGDPFEVRFQNIRLKKLNVEDSSVSIAANSRSPLIREPGPSHFLVDALGRQVKTAEKSPFFIRKLTFFTLNRENIQTSP